MFEDEGTARTKLLTHLGFSIPIEEKGPGQDDISKEVSGLGLEESVAEKAGGFMGDRETTSFPSDNGEDFFNNLPSPKADTPLSTHADNFNSEGTDPSQEQKLPQDLEEHEENSDPSFDDGIQRALVVGDYKGAVAQCISANRIADALVIAHVGGASLWESTRDQYLKMSRSPYLKVPTFLPSNVFSY